MKTFPFSPRCLALGLVAAGGSLLAAAPEAKTPPPPAPPSHVLFMGADLSVAHDKKVYRVEDIVGSDIKIRVDKQAVYVPTRQGPVGLQVNANLKIAAVSVLLDKMHAAPAYTYENDPIRKMQESATNQMVLAHTGELAMGQMTQAWDTQARAQHAVDAGSRDPAAAQRELDAANAAVRQSERQMGDLAALSAGDVGSASAGVLRMKGAEGNFDAMEVYFTATSPVELDHPYMVILVKFHDPRNKPGEDGLMIHAQSLEPINTTPRYVRVLKGGMPIGFSVVECAVHIYNHGAEVATNLSSKRVEMTRSETQQYIVMEFLGGQKGRPASPAAVHGTLSQAQREHLAPDQLNRVLFAKVSKDGTLLGVFADEDCGLRIEDPATLTALGEVFFTPAVQQGKPVDGVARVRLSDI